MSMAYVSLNCIHWPLVYSQASHSFVSMGISSLGPRRRRRFTLSPAIRERPRVFALSSIDANYLQTKIHHARDPAVTVLSLFVFFTSILLQLSRRTVKTLPARRVALAMGTVNENSPCQLIRQIESGLARARTCFLFFIVPCVYIYYIRI